jgi:hypothetical protein
MNLVIVRSANRTLWERSVEILKKKKRGGKQKKTNIVYGKQASHWSQELIQ